jgi:uncharacterized glyoxalase superfamily protein PhnB
LGDTQNRPTALSQDIDCEGGYRNAPKAIEWRCRVFGFEKHAVFAGPDNTIMHAELTLGGGMMMLGSVNQRAPNRNMKLPSELGGAQTRGVSLIVEDADEVYARAKAAGAVIVEDIEDKPFGGRGFACLDPEGHIWHVGTYDPWAAK